MIECFTDSNENFDYFTIYVCMFITYENTIFYDNNIWRVMTRCVYLFEPEAACIQMQFKNRNVKCFKNI